MLVIMLISNLFECFLGAEVDGIGYLFLFFTFHYGKFQTHIKAEHPFIWTHQISVFFFHAFPLHAFYSRSQTSYHFIINTLVYISRGEDFLKNHKTVSQPTKFITIPWCHIIVCACSSFPACGKEVFHSWLVQFRIPMKSLHCILFL